MGASEGGQVGGWVRASEGGQVGTGRAGRLWEGGWAMGGRAGGVEGRGPGGPTPLHGKVGDCDAGMGGEVGRRTGRASGPSRGPSVASHGDVRATHGPHDPRRGEVTPLPRGDTPTRTERWASGRAPSWFGGRGGEVGREPCVASHGNVRATPGDMTRGEEG